MLVTFIEMSDLGIQFGSLLLHEVMAAMFSICMLVLLFEMLWTALMSAVDKPGIWSMPTKVSIVDWLRFEVGKPKPPRSITDS